MDVEALVAKLIDSGDFTRIMGNVRAQFGRSTRMYKGAEILPEQTVTENSYTEDEVQFRTIIATDGTPYSPVQQRDGDLVGSIDVKLGDSDIGRQMTGRTYDAVLKILDDLNADIEQAGNQILNWTDTVINGALIEKAEAERWQAIIDAQVTRKIGAVTEIVSYPNPDGHRFNAGGNWSDDTYDPFDDIEQAVLVLEEKGYRVSRILTSNTAVTKLTNNDKVKQRVGPVVITAGSVSSATGVRISLERVNEVLAEDGLPPIERYDLRYRTESGSERFLASDAMAFIAESGRDIEYDVGDTEYIPLFNTLGYYAIGTPSGHSMPGRKVLVKYHEKKPIGLDAEGYQKSLPVLTVPEGIAVIRGIT